MKSKQDIVDMLTAVNIFCQFVFPTTQTETQQDIASQLTKVIGTNIYALKKVLTFNNVIRFVTNQRISIYDNQQISKKFFVHSFQFQYEGMTIEIPENQFSSFIYSICNVIFPFKLKVILMVSPLYSYFVLFASAY